jgi:hypothetical protein
MDADAWIGPVLPGDALVLTINAGGERWTLGQLALHAGDGLELLTEGERRWCEACNGEGRRCLDCGGRGYLFRGRWCPVRFEYVNAGDGTGHALLYLAGPGLGGEERHAIRVRKGDGLRLRAAPCPSVGWL